VPLAIHTGTGTAADNMLYHYLRGLRTAHTAVAFTIGDMLACAALIVGGMLERHPKLGVVHLDSGVGWVAFWLDRLPASVQGGFRGLEIPGLKRPTSATSLEGEGSRTSTNVPLDVFLADLKFGLGAPAESYDRGVRKA
jgi:hypothetical protein